MRRVYLSLLAGGIVAVTGLTIGLIGCNTSGTNEGTRLNGAGATFPEPLIQEWKQAYKAAKGVEIDYDAKGSGLGIQQVTARTVQFGCSDAPMKKAQLDAAMKEGGEVIHIPITMGPIVPAYNVPGITSPLIFSGPVLADIYMGKIKNWNDPAIKTLNQDAKLPDLAIAPIFRAEASGTTANFKEFLAKCSPEFKKTVGVSTEPTWTQGVGLGERGNDGVAKRVNDSTGAIGYVELRYAKKNGLNYGPVINPAGKAVMGGPETVTSSAASAMTKPQIDEPYSLHELTFSMTNAEGENSYPISAISYCIFYKKQPAVAGKTLVAFLSWAVTDGQKMATNLDYAPLPDDLVKKIEARLKQVEFTP
jgi:phosphate transport system substrate-binding protein